MINVAELIHDPDFCTKFKRVRQIGSKVGGRWVVEREDTKTITGVVSGVNSKDLEILPEGDRVKELKTFYALDELRVTGNNATSDICEYKDSRYKLIQGFDYSDYGYYKAIGIKLGCV